MIALVFCLGFLLLDDNPAPNWLKYVCGSAVLVGVVSAAICVTTALSGLACSEKKQGGVADHVA
jgi:hypothetical protein